MVVVKNTFIVILAGGKGERLWPLSRQHHPKQFLTLSDGYTLLEHTVNRVKNIVPANNLCIVTTKNQEKLVQESVGHSVGHIISEPESRNTAAAVLLSCMYLIEQHKDAFVCFLPADHFVSDQHQFESDFIKTIKCAQKNEGITLLGVTPTFPATGYGYIEYEDAGSDVFYNKVMHFHEKPSKEIAQLYLNVPTMLWNIGICCAYARFFIQEFNAIAPDVYQSVYDYARKHASYQNVPSISVDYAVLEKSDHCFVYKGAFTWSDVGNLDVFLHIDSNKKDESVILINAHNNVVNAKKELVALIDVDDLCVVQTDDVLLIAKRGQTDKVKQVISALKESKYEEYL